MRIHCDVCGVEIMKEDAIAVQDGDEVYYCCSDKCVEERSYHETMQDPGPGDEASPPDDR